MLYSEDLTKIIIYSKQEAKRLGNESVEPEHLLLGILRLGRGKAYNAIAKKHTDDEIKQLKQELDKSLIIGNHTPTEGDNLKFTRMTERIIHLMDLEALALKSKEDDAEHLLLALLKDGESTAAEILNNHDISYDDVMSNIKPSQKPKASAEYVEENDDDAPSEKTHTATKSSKNSATPALDTFGTDLTKKANEGKIDPVIGRNNEIERIVQILSRRKKNNPVLIGEPGVGKSAIVEGLALRIAQKNVNHVLYDKRIVALDMSHIVSGTKYRGQFEERMEAIINELKAHPEVILFIDEIHTIIGAGGASGSLDAANMLKPALSRGEIQCIGSTTLNEYRTSIEKDGALERRFQKIIVNPTTKEETLQILTQIAPYYEKYHNVRYSQNAIKACVELTARYISDRAFPDKALDAMDEAGAKAHVSAVRVPQSINELEHKIEDIKSETEKVLANHDYEKAIALRDKEQDLQLALQAETARWKKEEQDRPVEIGEEDIAGVVSLMSGVPVQRIAQAENDKLRNMAAKLQTKVIGQDRAITEIVKSIQRSRLGLKDPKKPIGTFLFLGPTGVGKTHLAQCLAEEMFGSRDAIIRIDMSEYMEKFSVSRLTGAPPGYVGYEEGGQLTEKVRRKPYSIVLFDEMEKAHPDVYNILLQVMDEGRLTDSLGRFIDFKNTIIIMTSNVGSKQVKDFGKGIGFSSSLDLTNANAESIIRKELNKHFQPEFLNRIDEVIMFDQLSRDSIHQIIDLELAGLYDRVNKMGYSLRLTAEAKDFIADKGYDVQYGARPLKRAIQKYAEGALTDILLEGKIEQGKTIELQKHDDTTKAVVVE
ncbi:MAG: ATP-dependent Clp protease ATP-binding subunit [Paludibacteraceae bacterium]|nr:ATP-dependent Clp protease ATP-binding subunit [Paludibacteraceae bacterium]